MDLVTKVRKIPEPTEGTSGILPLKVEFGPGRL
jgi:hypothetical protein